MHLTGGGGGGGVEVIDREREDKKVGNFCCIIFCLAITIVGWEAFGKE